MNPRALFPERVDVDATNLVDGTIAVERALQRRSPNAPSDGTLIRRATRTVSETDGVAWDESYPSIERIALAGLSSVPAPLVDLCSAVTSHCDVDVHLFVRPGTGSFLKRRLGDVWSVSNPGRTVIT